MSTQTAASAAGAAALPAVAPAPAQPVIAPASSPAAPAAPTSTVAVPSAESLPPTGAKSALEFIESSGDDLAKRYGFSEGDTSSAAEPETAPDAVSEAATSTDPAAPEPPTTDPIPSETPTAAAVDPITKFSMYDEQGEFQVPMNVKLSFKAGGQEFKDLRIDEVVRMAQQAPNVEHQRQTERSVAAQQLAEAAQAHHAALAELHQNNALYEQLLTNPALYQEAAARFQAMNSPEQRLARIEAQRAQEQTQYQQQVQQVQLQQVITAAANYTASRIAPSVDALATKYANSPAFEPGDVMAKFHELTAPLMAASPNGGVWVPPNRLSEIETSVIPQLEAWASAKARRATTASQAANDQARAQIQKAQLDAQLATRQLTRPLTPVGSAPGADVPRPKPIKSANDAIAAIVDKASAQIRGAA